MSLDNFSLEELIREVARREVLDSKFKPNDYVIPRNSSIFLSSRDTYRIVSTKGPYVRVMCNDGILRGVHEDFFDLSPLDVEEEFGGPDESFY